MGDLCLNLNDLLSENGFERYVRLKKDRKAICRMKCYSLPADMYDMPQDWSISHFRPKTDDFYLGLPKLSLFFDPEDAYQQKECQIFFKFLLDNQRVAIGKVDLYEFYIHPPVENSKFLVASYRRRNAHKDHVSQQNCRPGQIHSGWIFGAIAELVDNSRDAKAITLKVSIEVIYSKQAGKDIPMLSVIDDGHGMTHPEILRLITFGHKQPDADDPNNIGRFGVGFKTGAMRLGKDALVLTQTAISRSIAFLSQSLNEGKDNLEVPIVSYSLQGQIMEVDTGIQSKASAKYNLNAIKEFSPFNKYLIGEKEALFKEKGRGTQIYIWNLDEWGSDYCLEWVDGISGGSSFHKGDILIRSRRCRSRPGQMARKVQLDFSLRAYLEVMFFDPRMKVHVQGSLVNSRPLAKSLNKTVVEYGNINGKAVQLTLGRCQLEWEQANCGIFLYWHGRLIEAYKRVGGMLHNGDKSHGIIGVIDVTDLMNDGNGGVWVHNNKQSFQDCEVYAQLEDWLGKKVDEYLDNNFDKLQVRKGTSLYKPDHEWVQCDKCRKWRMLTSDFDSKTLPQEWFCYMKPFSGSCDMPEQKIQRGVITVSAKRSGFDPNDSSLKQKDDPLGKVDDISEGGSDDDSSQTVEDEVNPPSLKRLRKGPITRSCKKRK